VNYGKNNLILFAMVFTGLLIIFSYGIGSVSATANNQTVQITGAIHTTTPKVISIDPVNNSVNVPTTKTIKIKFNEPIKLGNKLIDLKNSNGIITPISTSINSNVLTIKHPKALSNGKYTLTLHHGSITDITGNKIAQWTSKFMVGPKVGYSIQMFDTSLGGNVLANPAINKISKTYLSNQIFQMTKQGSVILKFGNGNGPKLLITVGVHGNEPQSNIAAMKYLEYIKNKKFKGTIYIIPFDIPKDTALNTRYYNGLDPNRIANIKGSPGWKIVQFAKNNGIKYLIDVHSGGGVGKKGFIYHNAVSTKLEKRWTSYIVSKTGCSSGVDKADNPGMIRYAAHSKGINSITIETERDSSSVMKAAEAEFKMILSAARYLGFP
jgi:hypothetical protein